MQLDRAGKGFSFAKEGPLDMRMDPMTHITAKDIINSWSEEELGRLFRELGEEPRWKRAAKAVVEARYKKVIETTTELANVIATSLKTPFKGKLHPATLVFQALRICVNRELDSIAEGVSKAIHAMAPNGRMGVMSFHSLEDRIVKNIFREAAYVSKKAAQQGMIPLLHVLTKKPLISGWQEIRKNPRARSAKLRFAEKT